MAVSVNLPALGESVTEGTVTRWLKQEGDTVEEDEPLLEISTDKVDTEIPAPASGVLLSIKVREDETVEVGAELAVIGDASEAGDSGGGESSDQSDDATAGGEQVGSAETPDSTDSSDSTASTASTDRTDGTDSAASTDEPATTGTPQASTESSAPAKPSGGGAAGGSGTQVSVVLPALGESVTEGTVTRWLKQEGDTVEEDEPLLEISTDKVDTEIPAPASGVLVSIKVREDETVDVGAELAVIGSGGGGPGDVASEATTSDDAAASQEAGTEEPAAADAADGHAEQTATVEEPAATDPTPAAQAPAAQQPAPQQPAPQKTPAPAAPASSRAPAHAAPAEAGPGDQGAYVTPLVRKLATQRGVDLSGVTGTGVGGRIRKQDVLEAARAASAAAAAAPPATPASAPAASPVGATTASPPSDAQQPAAASPLRGRTEKLSRLRATIAKRMVESLRVSAQLTTVVEVDVTRIARLRARAKADFEVREGVKLSFLPFFAKAICESLKVYPQLNASIDQDAGEVTYHAAEHLGIAVDTERGLLVATIHDAGDLNIGGLARKIADLATRTRANKVSPDELSGGTFTLTNTGSRGALFDTPIIMQPQVGILGTGAVVKRPVVIDDPDLGETIAIRSMVYIALTYDHRLVDGADAARFLSAVKARLEEGAFESDLGL